MDGSGVTGQLQGVVYALAAEALIKDVFESSRLSRSRPAGHKAETKEEKNTHPHRNEYVEQKPIAVPARQGGQFIL